MSIPSEVAFGGVYMPPMFVAAVIGTILAVLTAGWLNRARLSRHFFYPPLVFVAMVVIYTVVVGTFVVPM